MLTEGMAALAAAGGAAVVSAAGTELWETFRSQVARLLGRGNDATEQITLERLDRTAAELEPAAADDSSAWASRFSDALEEASPKNRSGWPRSCRSWWTGSTACNQRPVPVASPPQGRAAWPSTARISSRHGMAGMPPMCSTSGLRPNTLRCPVGLRPDRALDSFHGALRPSPHLVARRKRDLGPRPRRFRLWHHTHRAALRPLGGTGRAGGLVVPGKDGRPRHRRNRRVAAVLRGRAGGPSRAARRAATGPGRPRHQAGAQHRATCPGGSGHPGCLGPERSRRDRQDHRRPGGRTPRLPHGDARVVGVGRGPRGGLRSHARRRLLHRRPARGVPPRQPRRRHLETSRPAPGTVAARAGQRGRSGCSAHVEGLRGRRGRLVAFPPSRPRNRSRHQPGGAPGAVGVLGGGRPRGAPRA